MMYITTYPLTQRINPMRKLLLTTVAVAMMATSICSASAAQSVESFGARDTITDSIICTAVVIGGFAVIYLIANMVGRGEKDKGGASESEPAKEQPASNDSEKPLRPVTAAVCPMWIKIFFALCAMLVVCGVYVAVDEINRGVFVWNKRNVDLLIVVICAPTLFGVLNIKHTFNDDGITVKAKIYFLFFTVHKESTLIPWVKICHIDYGKNDTGRLHHKVFKFITMKRTIVLLWLDQNNVDALAFAVTKLPKYKFTVTAQEKLKEMGIWTAE